MHWWRRTGISQALEELRVQIHLLKRSGGKNALISDGSRSGNSLSVGSRDRGLVDNVVITLNLLGDLGKCHCLATGIESNGVG